MSDTQKPLNNYVSSAAEQTTPQKVDGEPGPGRSSVEVPSAPKSNSNADEKEKNSRKQRKPVWASLPFGVSIISVIISFFAYQNTGRSVNAAEDSAGAAKRSADAAEQSAAAAQQNANIAERALTAAVERDRRDARAWVGVTEVVNSTIEKDVPIQITVTLQGSGKTPAVNVRGKTVWSTFRKDEEFCPRYGNNPPQAGSSNAIIFSEQKVFLTTIPKSVDPEVITQLETGDLVLYHYGTIDYEDVFDPPTAHCTTFCYVYNQDLKMPHPCGTYNKVTDTKCEAGCQAPPSVSSVLK